MARRGWGLAAAALLAVTSLAACAPEQEAPRAVFLGDSYTIGTALPPEQVRDRWATQVSTTFGWEEINAGCDGSGYTRPGLRCMTTYRERIDRLIEDEPDIIVISGGVNDLGATPGEIKAAVKATFLTLRETFPDAEIYAINGIYYEGDAAPALLDELNEAVATQAAAVGATYVDIGEPLLGRPDLLAVDGLHPNAEGHTVIAKLTSNVIGEVG